MKLIKTKAMNLLNKLEDNINVLKETHQKDWDQIIRWNQGSKVSKLRQNITNAMIMLMINSRFYDKNIYF